jgi:hypothetical protein
MDVVIGRTAPVNRARAKKRDPSDTAKKKKKRGSAQKQTGSAPKCQRWGCRNAIH